MPIVKIDHVVSFSSEDPKHPANNLLIKDPAKKWKCQNSGEKSINVILQLEKATLINGIDIGNEHSAYIEVLVTRSSRNDDFKPFLVMSSFMSSLESRQSQNVNKVRMFTQSQLSKPECDEKWDRIKVVCTQPFNRHVQYGLSFIVIHSSDQTLAPQTQTAIGNSTLRPDSPDPFTPGKLFASWKDQQPETPLKGAAAIRLSTTPAYLAKHGPPVCKAKNITPKPSSTPVRKRNSSEEKIQSRNRDSLLYDKEDEEPNDKIDNIVKRDQELKEKKKAASDEEPSTSTNKRAITSPKKERTKRKAEDDRTPKKNVKKQNLRKPFNSLLNGVVLTISGIINPDRGRLRTLALEMGAKYKPDWDDTCTHLICAFVNTPKFNQVKGKGKIVKKQWIEECHKERKRLPWRRYALDRNDHKKDESEEEIFEEVSGSDNEDRNADTDEEIERIRQQQSKPKKAEKVLSDTDEETIKPPSPAGKSTDLLDVFKDKTFFIDTSFEEDIYRNIRKYIIGYAGEVVDDPTDDNIQVFITVKDNSSALKEINPNGAFLDVNWIWDCHNAQKLIPINKYVL